MGTNIADWPRNQFRPGGGNPFLFYVLFGEIDQTIPLSRSKYRTKGVPDPLEMSSFGPDTHPDVLDSFRSGYIWDNLNQTDPAFAKIIAAQKTCIVLRGDFPDEPNLNYLRDTIGLITYFLDSGAGAVYDPQSFRWWSPDQWRETVFKPAAAVPRQHAIILVSDNPDKTLWIHTRGMRKFGRPDISLPKVDPAWKAAAIDLCNRFIEMEAFGAIVPDGQEIRMGTLPPGLYCRLEGSLDDPDFNNLHLSIGTDS